MFKQSKNIVFAFCPYGDFDIQCSTGYLKAYLKQKAEINSTCVDINIEFFSDLGFVTRDRVYTHEENKYKKDDNLLALGNWTSEKGFFEKINSREEVQKSYDHFVDRLLALNPGIIGFSMYETNRYYSFELMKRLKEKAPQIPIIIGGPDSTSMKNIGYYAYLYYDYLKNGIFDFISVGESEETMLEFSKTLLKSYEDHPNWENYNVEKFIEDYNVQQINGLILRSKNSGSPLITQDRPLIKDLNTIPYPDFSDYNPSLYEQAHVPIIFNRGCPYRCTYCNVKNVWSDMTMRSRDAENVIGEVKAKLGLLDYAAHRNFEFRGAYINTGKKILKEVSEKIIEEFGENPPFTWTGWVRVNTNLNAESCALMRRAGCRQLVVGFESASEKITGPMLKSYPQKIAKQVIKDIGEAGIQCSLFMIVGFPTETEEEFQFTLDFLEENAKYIHSCYCFTEFLLSDEMSKDPVKWNLKEPVDPYAWETLDGKNTLAIRKERLQRFYQHCRDVGISLY